MCLNVGVQPFNTSFFGEITGFMRAFDVIYRIIDITFWMDCMLIIQNGVNEVFNQNINEEVPEDIIEIAELVELDEIEAEEIPPEWIDEEDSSGYSSAASES